MSPGRPQIAGEWLVFCVIVVDLIGFGIVIPILPFIAPILGGDEFDVALVIAIYSLCAGITGPFWGALSDRLGRRTVLMICLAGGAVSYLLLGLAAELWMVYAARAFSGVMAGSLPVASALMADVSPPNRRAKAMGLVGTAFGLGLILGPLIGGLLAGDGSSFTLAGAFAGGLSLSSVLLAWLLLPNDRPLSPVRGQSAATQRRVSAKQFVRRSGSGMLLLQYVLHTLAVSSAIYLTPLWLAALLDWGPREVGLLFGLVGFGMIIIQGALLDWLTHRFGLLQVLSTGAVIFALSLSLAPFLGGAYPRATVIFMAFTGATCVLPVLNTIASFAVSADERGRMMGLTASAAAIGRVIGPLIAGGLLLWAGYTLVWIAVALPVLCVWAWSKTAAVRYDPAHHRHRQLQSPGDSTH